MPQLPAYRDGGDGLLPGEGHRDSNNEQRHDNAFRIDVLSAIECHLANQPRDKILYKVQTWFAFIKGSTTLLDLCEDCSVSKPGAL